MKVILNKLLFVALLLPCTLVSQTSPVAQVLPYSQDFGTAGFTTMPAGTASWNGLDGDEISTQGLAEASTPTGNATLNSRTTKTSDGGTYGFHNNSNARLYIQSSLNSTNGVNQFVIAVNTGSYTVLDMNYDIEMVNEGSGRSMGVVAQFRKPPNSWTTISSTAVVYNNTSVNMGDDDNEGDIDSYSFSLTSLTANSVYEIRFAVWRSGASGGSVGLAFDNININGGSICSVPSAQATSFVSPSQTNQSIDYNFQRGNGTGGVLVVARVGGPITAIPTNSTTYSANSHFGNGSEIASGNFVVFNGMANGPNANSGTITMTGLTGGMAYYFAVFEYNGSTGNECYLSPALPASVETKCSEPAQQSQALFVSPNIVSIDVGFAAAGGSPSPNGYLVVRSTIPNPACNPQDGTIYVVGDVIDDCKVISVGSALSLIDNGLAPATTYYYKIFSYIGNGNNVCPNYLTTSPLSGFGTTFGIPVIIINEIDSDTPGSDDAEFIELSGPPNEDLDGLVLVLFNGATDASYQAIDLDGYTLNNQGFFVYCSNQGNVANCDAAGSAGFLQNGADAVGLFAGDDTDFTFGTSVTATNLIDAIVYGNGHANDDGLLAGLNQSQQMDEDQNGNGDVVSLQRVGGGWIVNTPTPGVQNLVLPVEIVFFIGKENDGKVQLDWQTQSEINNDKFVIQHSNDGVRFFEIGSVKGASNSLQLKEYRFLHPNPVSGENYYRLAQVDFDGRNSHSNTVLVMVNNKAVIQVFPTIVQDWVTIVFSDIPEEKVEVVLFDNMGQTFLKISKRINEKELKINASTLKNGIYFLQIMQNGSPETIKIVKF